MRDNSKLVSHIFDLDRTFFIKNVSFAFYFYLLRNRLISIRTLPRVVQIFVGYTLGRLNLEALHQAIFQHVLKGLVLRDLESAADHFLANVDRMVCPSMLHVLRETQKAGHATFLLSSSPDFLVSRIAKKFSFDRCFGTHYLVDKEGRLCEISVLVTGSKKREIAHQWLNRGFGSVAYSDSFEDIHLLEWVQYPIVIRPCRKLKKYALQRKWCIMDQKTKISPKIFSPSPDKPNDMPLFGERVFDQKKERLFLTEEVVEHLREVRAGLVRFDPGYADAVAEGMKEWAIQHGATHFTHWFQPLTHLGAERHDSFLNRNFEGAFSLQFRGKELLFGEPDGSSFPSGGMRHTHEARGYTAWDPMSFPFLWESGEGLTLCIPALFYSWHGIALDHKIPLLRSNQKIESAARRLVALCHLPAKRAFATVGIEQEYFLIDEQLFKLRPDLILTGRMLFGAKPAKGQELEDHYCGVVKPSVLEFMRDFEQAALRLGIPVKTRHNEVAPSQYEVAPLFETAALACDHNLLLMEVMRRSAAKFGFTCLFHEKPFLGFNGSGKHNNWSLGTDTGLNLLDPKENSLSFLTLLAAVLLGVHEHAGLLRASIGSVGNDHRLGGSEAPPSILSVFLGGSLEQLIHEIIQEKPISATLTRTIDLGLAHMPLHIADPADRNRTSFFVFTGNKFEFRAVGASAASAFPIAILNAIVADSLQLILDEIEDALKRSSKEPLEAALPVLRKHFRTALPVLFGGNNYAAEWHKEAEERGLPHFARSYHAFHALRDKKSIRVLEQVFDEKELESRFEILVEQYAKTMTIEAQLMLELFTTQIVPSVQSDLRNRLSLFESAEYFNLFSEAQKKMAVNINHLLDEAIGISEEIKRLQAQSQGFGWEMKAKVLSELVWPKMDALRKTVDALELQTDRDLWPLPKMQELLF